MRLKKRAFTLIELLVVMVIIAILVGLILSTARFVRQKAATARADAENHGLETACESYKTDNGAYPDSTAVAGGASKATDTLDARKSGNPTAYEPASVDLYKLLSGDSANTGTVATGSGGAVTNYMADMPQKIYYHGPNQTSGPILYLQDPFGNSYGYSTIYNYTVTNGTSNTAPNVGYNPTFDLWSTAGNSTAPSPGQPGDITLKWVKNWQ